MRSTEADFTLAECFDRNGNCRLDGRCRLKATLQRALAGYLAVLDGVTLAELVAPAGPGAGGAARRVPGLP